MEVYFKQVDSDICKEINLSRRMPLNEITLTITQNDVNEVYVRRIEMTNLSLAKVPYATLFIEKTKA